jgi:hypothetical protein
LGEVVWGLLLGGSDSHSTTSKRCSLFHCRIWVESAETQPTLTHEEAEARLGRWLTE